MTIQTHIFLCFSTFRYNIVEWLEDIAKFMCLTKKENVKALYYLKAQHQEK